MKYKIISIFLILVTNINAANIKFSNKSTMNDYSITIDNEKFLTIVSKNSESGFFKLPSKTAIKIQDREQVVYKQTLLLDPSKTYVGIFGGVRVGSSLKKSEEVVILFMMLHQQT